MPRVTLSYRREDSAGLARLIFERLKNRFGAGAVFMDFDAIEFGQDYRERIDDALRQTDYLLLLIGPRWLGPLTAGETRIKQPNDPVRMEVERAFEIGLRVVPILLDRTPMPGADDLPETLRKLTYLNAADVTSGRDFDAQMEHVIRFIDGTPAKSSARAPKNAPALLSPLIGRERELGEIDAALARSRLVTITGSGGVGKTRVALQCATSAIDRFEHGAWFIDLAPIADGALVPATVLAALEAGPAEEGSETAHLLNHLRPREALLVIDNCEQVVGEVAALVSRIHAAAPRVSVLATSRELLHLTGEQVFRLGPLAPKAAVELFAARAAAVVPGFDAHEHEQVVRDICDRLDGIPLAIELAAARVRVLSPNDISARLHERFRLLTSSSHTAVPRQQTLAATIEWSYDLLAPKEQALFERLAVFRGGFSLGAAAAVCCDGDDPDEFEVLDILTSLADKSLLTVTLALTTRYRLLESIRALAAAKAIEHKAEAIARDHHAAYFAALAAQAYHEFDSRLPAGWLERLAPDIDNFRAALAYLLEGPGDRNTGAQLAADCGPIFLRMQLLAEGLRWCEAARAVPSVSAATTGRIEYVASMMQNNLGQNEAALTSARRAVALLRASSEPRGLVRALSQEAQLMARSHRYDEAKAPAEEAIGKARELGDPRLLVAVLRRCAFSLPPSEIERARVLFEEALNAARSAHAHDEMCRVLQWWSSRESGNRAIELATQALEWAEGDVRTALELTICVNALVSGRLNDAEPHARSALTSALERNDPLMRALAIAFCTPFLSARAPEDAALLFGYACGELSQLEWSGEEDDRLALEAASHVIKKALPERSFEALVQRGTGLRLDEAQAVLMPALAGRDAGDGSTHAVGDGVGTLLR
ncbi:MAG TPA: TIR domain-containing protein [Candidatus Baltobacteraceae bacterium]|nr:TIR domain-containing protein [Candidatus Baltobacteraceae bacterium]